MSPSGNNETVICAFQRSRGRRASKKLAPARHHNDCPSDVSPQEGETSFHLADSKIMRGFPLLGTSTASQDQALKIGGLTAS